MRVLIVGCGYVGLPLGVSLNALGHQVFGLRRNPPVENGGGAIQWLPGDITQPPSLEGLPHDFDWVVNCVASGGGTEGDYRQVYLEGTRNLLAWLKGAPLKKFIYTSSTGVYGQSDGSAVKEDSPTEPLAPTAQVLVETERLLLDAARSEKFPAVILRLAGIYGPDRGHYFKMFLANEARVEGDGLRVLNMIHRDDVVGVIVAALKSARAGSVYNVVDDEPVGQVHFYRWLAETLGKWMPPTVSEPAERRRGATNKRVLNRRLHMELGYQFRYPTFRQGYTAEIQRLDQAGQLDLPPEPR